MGKDISVLTDDNIDHGHAQLEDCLEANICRFKDGFVENAHIVCRKLVGITVRTAVTRLRKQESRIMTNKEAYTWILDHFAPCDDGTKQDEALGVALKALEKQTPKKPKHVITNMGINGNFRRECPSCGWLMFERVTTKDASEPVVCRIFNFCQLCGQAIDWGES